MQVLTTQGYKPIEDIVSSDNIIAYDAYTGQQIINHLNYKQKWQEYDFEGTASITYDEWDGNNVITKTNIIIPEMSWQFYKINNIWTLYGQESIWVNNYQVVHISELQIGDIIYDENNNDIVITDIQPVTSSEWWRLSISGDHSFIADGLTLHNPSRYWVGGGSSTNFSATANTNWSATSGGSITASVPTASDDIFYDGSGSRGNDNCTVTNAVTVTNITFSGSYTGSFNIANATVGNNGNFICDSTTSFTVTSANAALGPAGSSGTIATNGNILPFRILYSAAANRTISGSDLTIIPTFSASQAGFQYSAGSILNRTSNERLITCGFTGPGAGGVLLSGSADVYVIGGTVNFGAFTDTGIQRNRLFISSSIASLPVTISRVVPLYIEYVGGTVNMASSQLGSGTAANPTVINTPGITWNLVGGINSSTNTFFLSASLTASTIQAKGNAVIDNTGLTFSGSAGFLCNTLAINSNSSTNKALVLQAGNTYIVTGSLNIGTISTANFLHNVAGVGSGANPKLILREGAACSVIANFTNIDASGGRTINTFAGTLTNTTNIRSFTDLTTAAYSSVG